MKKSLLIILVIIIVISIGSIVSAQEYSFSDPNDLREREDNYLKDQNTKITVFYNYESYYAVITTEPIIHYDGSLKYQPYSSFQEYKWENNKWVYKTFSGTESSYRSLNYSNIVYADYNILYDNGNVFFYKTVKPPFLLDNKTLLQPLSLSVMSNSQTLLVFGVGILSLILLVGLFRKLYLYL